MTKGNISREIFLFTLPLMAGNFLQQLYSTVDGIVVGQFVSENALASIGTCTPVTVLYIALALGLSTGSGIIVAQYFGAGLREDLREAVSTDLILLTLLGVVLAIVGALITEPLMRCLLGVPEAELPAAVLYLHIYCAGLIFQFVYNIAAAILRALGDSKVTLYFLLVSSCLNIVLDLIFVIGLRAGVAGAAWATVISQAASAVISVIYMFRRYEILRFRLRELTFSREKCMLSLKMGVPTTLQQCVISMGNIFLQRLVNSFGEQAMAGYTAGVRLESFLVIPSLGFSSGYATFTGQNIGAGRMDRVKKGYRTTLKMSFFFCLILVVLAVLFRKPLVGLFGVTGASRDFGITYLLYSAPCFLLFSLYQTSVGVLQGAGDVMWTMFFSLSSLGARVAISYPLASAAGFLALPYSMLLAWIYVTIAAYLRYKHGGWKKKAVVKDDPDRISETDS